MSDIIKKDRKLAEAARKIFGNLVKTAYVTTYDGLDKDNSEVEKRLKLNSQNWMLINETNLRHDAQTILIEFSNGRLIGFTNSEWGGLFLQEEKLKRL
jgi:hypothetical protein